MRSNSSNSASDIFLLFNGFVGGIIGGALKVEPSEVMFVYVGRGVPTVWHDEGVVTSQLGNDLANVMSVDVSVWLIFIPG